MARRHSSADPELAALARERLRRLLDDRLGDRVDRGPRRAVDPPPPVVAGSLAPESTRSVDLDDLQPVRRFTRWHLGVVAVVLLVGVVWGGWSLLRNRPEAIAAPAAVETSGGPVASSTAAAGGAGPPAASSAAAGLVVHVLGAVRKPGLVRLDAGARVEDAIDAAGGLTRDADPDQLNLAQPLGDGEQVLIGTRTHPAGEVRTESGSSSSAGGSTSGGGSTQSSGAVVDLNRASSDQLEALPGVGPVTAQKIVAWRQQHGRFSKTEELQEVDGIGPKTYAQIAPHVRV